MFKYLGLSFIILCSTLTASDIDLNFEEWPPESPLPVKWRNNDGYDQSETTISKVAPNRVDSPNAIQVKTGKNGAALYTAKSLKVAPGDELHVTLQVKGQGKTTLHNYCYGDKVKVDPGISLEPNEEQWQTLTGVFIIRNPESYGYEVEQTRLALYVHPDSDIVFRNVTMAHYTFEAEAAQVNGNEISDSTGDIVITIIDAPTSEVQDKTSDSVSIPPITTVEGEAALCPKAVIPSNDTEAIEVSQSDSEAVIVSSETTNESEVTTNDIEAVIVSNEVANEAEVSTVEVEPITVPAEEPESSEVETDQDNEVSLPGFWKRNFGWLF